MGLGLLTSSGVATNPTGRFLALFSNSSFCCSFDRPILSHNSVITIPGTTPDLVSRAYHRISWTSIQFTRIFFSVSSFARPWVIVNSPLFREPPIDAVVPGVMAPVPEVNVKEPPGLIMSYLETTFRILGSANLRNCEWETWAYSFPSKQNPRT